MPLILKKGAKKRMISIVYVLIGIFIALVLIDLFFLSRTAYKLGAVQVIFRFLYKPGLIKFEKPKIKVVEKESAWVFATAIVLCAGIIAGEFMMKFPETNPASYAGAAIVFAGGIIFFLSRKTLGRYFTFQVVIQEKQKLVKSGIYKKVRHPGYFSILLVFIGLSISLSAYFGLVFVIVLLLPAVLFRISREEEMLISEFKSEYLKYMESSKKIIPYVY